MSSKWNPQLISPQVIATSLLTLILLFLVTEYVKDTTVGRRMYGRSRSLIKEWTGIHRLGLAEQHQHNHPPSYAAPGHTWQQLVTPGNNWSHLATPPTSYHLPQPIIIWPPIGGIFYSSTPVGIWLVIPAPKSSSQEDLRWLWRCVLHSGLYYLLVITNLSPEVSSFARHTRYYL